MATPTFGNPDEDLYRVRLQGRAALGEDGELIDVDLWGWIPENWTLESQASYSAKLANVGDFIPEIIRTGFTAGLGFASVSQLLTLQTYEHSNPLSFSFPFYFYATENAAKDVTQKVSMLIQLQQPYKKGGSLLYSPGPNYKDFLLDQGESLVLTIGKLMRIPYILVKSAQAQWETMADREGNFILCKVDLTMETAFVPTRSDIKDYFIVNGIDQQAALASSSAYRTRLGDDVAKQVTKLASIKGLGEAATLVGAGVGLYLGAKVAKAAGTGALNTIGKALGRSGGQGGGNNSPQGQAAGKSASTGNTRKV